MAQTSGRRPEDLFDGHPQALTIFLRIHEAVRAVGEVTLAVTKSQASFRRRKSFAYVWRPGQYVSSEVPAVLSIALPHELTSPRIKQVVHPSRGVWMHHIELWEADEVDEEVRAWLEEAFRNAD